MKVLVMRWCAPLMSFGGEKVDAYNVTREFPGLSMVCGILANALGYTYAQIEEHEQLQSRLMYAVREDKPGTKLQDFHTVDLGHKHMSTALAWTTRGVLEQREGGSSKSTHIRLRDYWADAIYTVVVALKPSDTHAIQLEDLAYALEKPARPLFLGRKCCLPSSPLVAQGSDAILKATDLKHALSMIPRDRRASTKTTKTTMRVWMEASASERDLAQVHYVTDRRDWANQIHTGQRCIVEDTVDAPSRGGAVE